MGVFCFGQGKKGGKGSYTEKGQPTFWPSACRCGRMHRRIGRAFMCQCSTFMPGGYPLGNDGAAWHWGIVFKRAGRKHRNQPYTRQKRVVVRPVVWQHCGSFCWPFFRHARPTVVFYLHSHQGRQYFTVWWGRRVRRHFMERKP